MDMFALIILRYCVEKRIYPYEFADPIRKLGYAIFPQKQAVYSTLNASDKDAQHALGVCKNLLCIVQRLAPGVFADRCSTAGRCA